MSNRVKSITAALAVLLAFMATLAFTQGLGPGPFHRGGPGGPDGPGGGGPMDRPQRQLLEAFDVNNDGWLNSEERTAARASMPAIDGDRGGRGFGPPRRRPGGRFGRGNREAPQPGLQISPQDVEGHPDAPLYDPTVLRTIFLDFDNSDWEAELEAFHNSDVDVRATLTVDGQQYPDVGVHFRGKSSYGMVPSGFKRSLNVSLDFIHDQQRLYGYKTLNLLNCHGDPSFLSTVLYSHIARQFVPAPRANLVKVVVNGESWGVYTNAQQFNKVFLKENFTPSAGTRWKVSGSPRGDGGLRYMGEDIDDYKRHYDMKSNDGDSAWQALVDLCRTLDETPADELQAALEPILDIDGVLKFLALDVALVNSDGYWTRASDYSIFLDKGGKFHLIPHDMNEAFRGGGTPRGFGPPRGRRGDGPPGPPGGRPPKLEDAPRDARPSDRPLPEADRPGPRGPRDHGQGDGPRIDGARGAFGPERLGRRGPGGRRPDGRDFDGPERGRRGPGGRGRGGPRHGGVDLDPLVATDDPRMPLRSRLLAVPKLKAKYLEYVRAIAETSLDWSKLGPVVAAYRDLIEAEVAADTRKLDSFEAFAQATDPDPSSDSPDRTGSLRGFADRRAEFLIEYLDSRQK